MNASLDNFPKELDGAKVLYAALTKLGEYTEYIDTGEKRPIVYYALAQYENDAGIYCFSVSASYEVIGDFLWDTVDEAMQVARDSFGIEKNEWTKIV